MNGSYAGELTTYPNKVISSCEEGFLLRGSEIRFCQANASWSGINTICEGKDNKLFLKLRCQKHKDIWSIAGANSWLQLLHNFIVNDLRGYVMRKKGLSKTRTLTSAMPMQAWVYDKPVETARWSGDVIWRTLSRNATTSLECFKVYNECFS